MGVYVVFSFFLRQYQCIIYIDLFFIQQRCCCTCMDELLVFSQKERILGRFLLFAYLLRIQNFRTLPPFCLLIKLLFMFTAIFHRQLSKQGSPQWSSILIFLSFNIWIYMTLDLAKNIWIEWVFYFSFSYKYIKFSSLIYLVTHLLKKIFK